MHRRLATFAVVITSCVVGFVIAANAFPDSTWRALEGVRTLGELTPQVFIRCEPPEPPSVWGFRQAADPDPIVARLANVDRFAFGGIGDAGGTSQGEADYRIIMVRPNALELLERLYRVGNLQGKSYALVGIHTLAPKRFRELSTPLRNSYEPVKTQAGCIMDEEPLRDVVRRIDNDRVVVKFQMPKRIGK